VETTTEVPLPGLETPPALQVTPEHVKEYTARKRLMVFAGRSHPQLAGDIAGKLGLELGEITLKTFANGETYVRYEESIRGADLFLVQTGCDPVDRNLMELLIMIQAAKLASAKRITVVVPWFPYSRQDKKSAPREPITGRLVADFLQVAGADRVLTMDLHAGQIQGFFNIPFDHLYGMPVFIDEFRQMGLSDVVVVSPDAGGVERARAYSKRMNATMAIIDKRRSAPNVSEVMHVVGDVKGKNAIIVDDIIDTAGTLCNAARAVMDAGARSVKACASHPVFSGAAIERIDASPLTRVVVTNTIPLSEAGKASSKIKVLSVGRLLGEAVKRIHHGDSISSLFI
jgi:ribose-phosphate pyrophosphokinase